MRLVADGDATGDTIKGAIGLIEPAGDATLVELRFEASPDAANWPGALTANVVPNGLATSQSLLCKAGARHVFSLGQRVRAAFDMQQAHWLDPQTGLRIDF